MTMRIYLFPSYTKNSLPTSILAMLDIGRLERIGKWLADLPPTKRGNPAFTYSHGGNRMPSVVFVRREDAVAFRLIFGL